MLVVVRLPRLAELAVGLGPLLEHDRVVAVQPVALVGREAFWDVFLELGAQKVAFQLCELDVVVHVARGVGERCIGCGASRILAVADAALEVSLFELFDLERDGCPHSSRELVDSPLVDALSI